MQKCPTDDKNNIQNVRLKAARFVTGATKSLADPRREGEAETPPPPLPPPNPPLISYIILSPSQREGQEWDYCFCQRHMFVHLFVRFWTFIPEPNHIGSFFLAQ